MKHLLPENTWEGSGIPAGIRERLLFNGPSQTLLAVIQSHVGRKEPLVRRLYCRRLPKSTYEPITLRHEFECHEHAHSCDAAPCVIFNEMRFRECGATPEYVKATVSEKHRPPPWGMDWIGIRKVNLITGEDKRVLDAENLNPAHSGGGSWISEILGVASDGTLATCVVGLDIGGRLDYSVFEISLAEGLRRKIADLPHTFL